MLLLALAFCVSALHIKDDAVTYDDIAASGDGVVTIEEEMTLGKVENLCFVQSARGSVTLTWDELENAYAYKVFVRYEDEDSFRYSYTVRANEVTIKDIHNEGALKFKVKGFCYNGGKVVYGEYSDTVEALTKPENVTKIYTRSITDDSVTLYWDKAQGATQYAVYIYDRSTGKYIKYKTTSRTTITVKALEKDTRYAFKVRSIKKAGDSSALGDISTAYKEYTYNSGSVPHTSSQVAQHYNELIAQLKAEENMAIQYKKTIDTEYIGCSKNNLATTVKNTLNLFEGTLKKTYTYKDGVNSEKSANKLIEPYGKKAALTGDDIQEYTITEKENSYTIKITLKSESESYSKGDSSRSSYFDGVLALPKFKNLETTPLVIDSADSYYDGGTLLVTVKEGRITKLDIQAAMLSDIDFSVADVKASTVVSYEMTEIYKIKYKSEN